MPEAPVLTNMEKQVLDSWYEEYFPLLFNYALFKLNKDQDAAADCAHAVFDAARKKIGTLKSHPNIGGWLMRAVQYEIAMYCKVNDMRSKRDRLFVGKMGIPKYSNSEIWTDDLISDEEIQNMKSKIMSILNQNEYKLYCLYYDEKMSLKGIVKCMGISEGATKMRLYRLRYKIIDYIENIFVP